MLGRCEHLTPWQSSDRLYGETVSQRNAAMEQLRESVLGNLPLPVSPWFPCRAFITVLLGLFGGRSEAGFHILLYGISPESGSSRRSHKIYLLVGQPGYTIATKEKGLGSGPCGGGQL